MGIPWLRDEWPLAAVNRAKVACPYGHPYEPPNLFVSCGKRRCRVCDRAQATAKKAGHPERWRDYIPWHERRVFG